MSPSLANSATKGGSFFSSPLWKRVFSRQRMSPSFIAAIAFAAGSPMQSSAKATGILMTFASASATGFSDSLGSRPFGRPKCASRITLPPLPAISMIPGAMRSRRVASLTRPLSMGTLRSTRTRTRLPFTSTSSRVWNVLVMASPKLVTAHPRDASLRSAPRDEAFPSWREARFSARVSNHESMRSSDQLAHRHGGVGHAVGEAPFVVVPAENADQRSALHLGLVEGEGRGMRIVVEVDRDVRIDRGAQNALQLAFGGGLERGVDLFLRRRLLGDDL